MLNHVWSLCLMVECYVSQFSMLAWDNVHPPCVPRIRSLKLIRLVLVHHGQVLHYLDIGSTKTGSTKEHIRLCRICRWLCCKVLMADYDRLMIYKEFHHLYMLMTDYGERERERQRVSVRVRVKVREREGEREIYIYTNIHYIHWHAFTNVWWMIGLFMTNL